MTVTLGEEKCREGSNVCMNYELNLLHHVGLVARRVCGGGGGGGGGARKERQYPFGPN